MPDHTKDHLIELLVAENMRLKDKADNYRISALALLEECYHYQNRLPQDCVLRLRAHLTMKNEA